MYLNWIKEFGDKLKRCQSLLFKSIQACIKLHGTCEMSYMYMIIDVQ